MDIWRTVIIVLLYLIVTLNLQCNAFTGRGLIYPGRTDLFELSIIHMNDFHARFEEVSPQASACQRDNGEQCIGGLPRILTASRQLLNERPNAVFLNAGDHYQGTLWYNVHRWNATAVFLNMLPHDVITIGNHEFDDGIEGLVPLLKAMNVPVVVTNIDTTNEPTIQNLMKNSTILHRGGKKIGVIGVILQSTPEIASTEKLIFLDEIETINLEAEKLKKEENVEIIIVLSHCGLEVDRKIAAECPLVDVIVGGHSHTFLYSGTQPFIDEPEDDYPVVVTQKYTNRTVLIVQAAAFTKYLGNLTVWFNENGEIEDWDGNPILLDDTIEQDVDMLNALAPWKIDVDAIADKIIGQTRVELKKDCRFGECNIGNMITDAMIESYINRSEDKNDWTYAAIAVMNGGGIRSPIDLANGDITYGDLVMAQPFENTWDVIELQGKDLRQTLEVTVARSQSKDHWNGYSFLVWSGIKIVYDMSKSAYSRVVDVKVQCQKCEIPIYEDLIDNKWYRIIVPSFLVHGGDGHSIIANNHRNHEVGHLDIDHLVKFVEKMTPLIYGKEGRITFVNHFN
ncbi:hypothetical protein PV328_004835 [Microctonus aethiopoides]|uniref:apyrase n=1 Tax=Microctonus aethiopoides TaxID=144406 RepID=A0AA39FBC0_9HYME|nr:hypothetical protein PV328_004835 [Microctonus aethiopoides]